LTSFELKDTLDENAYVRKDICGEFKEKPTRKRVQ